MISISQYLLEHISMASPSKEYKLVSWLGKPNDLIHSEYPVDKWKDNVPQTTELSDSIFKYCRIPNIMRAFEEPIDRKDRKPIYVLPEGSTRVTRKMVDEWTSDIKVDKKLKISDYLQFELISTNIGGRSLSSKLDSDEKYARSQEIKRQERKKANDEAYEKDKKNNSTDIKASADSKFAAAKKKLDDEFAASGFDKLDDFIAHKMRR